MILRRGRPITDRTQTRCFATWYENMRQNKRGTTHNVLLKGTPQQHQQQHTITATKRQRNNSDKPTATKITAASQSIARSSIDSLDEHAELPGQLEPVVLRHPDNVQKQPGYRLSGTHHAASTQKKTRRHAHRQTHKHTRTHAHKHAQTHTRTKRHTHGCRNKGQIQKRTGAMPSKRETRRAGTSIPLPAFPYPPPPPLSLTVCPRSCPLPSHLLG